VSGPMTEEEQHLALTLLTQARRLLVEVHPDLLRGQAAAAVAADLDTFLRDFDRHDLWKRAGE